MRRNPHAWAYTEKLATCNRCGDGAVAWVKSKRGFWYLATAYKAGDSFMVNKLDPHSQHCIAGRLLNKAIPTRPLNEKEVKELKVAIKIRAEKEQHPERFCSQPNCLWRVVTRSGNNPCKKHPQPQEVQR